MREIEGMYFRVPEMNNVRIGADPRMRPVVVITSNSEKQLPDAFLRRCVYFNLPFPKELELRALVAARLGEAGAAGGCGQHVSRLTQSACFSPCAISCGLRKPPATAGSLNWVATLRQMFPDRGEPAAGRRTAVHAHCSAR